MTVIMTSLFVMALALLIRKVFSGRLSGKALMAIWAIVFLKLAIPVSIPAAFSVMNLFAERPVKTEISAESAEADNTAPVISGENVYHLHIPPEDEALDTDAKAEYYPPIPAVSEIPAVYEAPDIYEAPAADSAGAPVSGLSFREVVNTVYVIVTTILETAVILAYIACAARFLQLERVKVPEKYEEKGISFKKGNIGTPAVFGIFRPVILFPFGAQICDNETTEHIILHEKTHIRHRDQLFNLLTLMICCLNWYNPLAWVCRALYLKDVEKWCDEAVIDRIGRANKKAYAESLLACAAERSRPLMLVSGFGESDIKGRIKAIMTDKKFKRGASLSVVLLTAAVLIAFGTGKVVKTAEDAVPDIPDTDVTTEENSDTVTGIDLLNNNLSGEYIAAHIEAKKEQFMNAIKIALYDSWPRPQKQLRASQPYPIFYEDGTFTGRYQCFGFDGEESIEKIEFGEANGEICWLVIGGRGNDVITEAYKNGDKICFVRGNEELEGTYVVCENYSTQITEKVSPADKSIPDNAVLEEIRLTDIDIPDDFYERKMEEELIYFGEHGRHKSDGFYGLHSLGFTNDSEWWLSGAAAKAFVNAEDKAIKINYKDYSEDEHGKKLDGYNTKATIRVFLSYERFYDYELDLSEQDTANVRDILDKANLLKTEEYKNIIGVIIAGRSYYWPETRRCITGYELKDVGVAKQGNTSAVMIAVDEAYSDDLPRKYINALQRQS